jgi:hypothetical protein
MQLRQLRLLIPSNDFRICLIKIRLSKNSIWTQSELVQVVGQDARIKPEVVVGHQQNTIPNGIIVANFVQKKIQEISKAIPHGVVTDGYIIQTQLPCH